MEDVSEPHQGKGLVMICWLFTGLLRVWNNISLFNGHRESCKKSFTSLNKRREVITQGHMARNWQSQYNVVLKNK